MVEELNTREACPPSTYDRYTWHGNTVLYRQAYELIWQCYLAAVF